MDILVVFFVVCLGLLMSGSVLLLLHYYLRNRGKEGNRLDEGRFFYIPHSSLPHNARLRDENATIFNVIFSEEADFRKYPRGQEIFEALRNFK